MRERVPKMVAAAQSAVMRYSADEVEEAVAFLGWLFEDNFLFLGYREYAIDFDRRLDRPRLRARHPGGRGIEPLPGADAADVDRAAPARAHHRWRPAARIEDEPVRDRAPARADGLRRCEARRRERRDRGRAAPDRAVHLAGVRGAPLPGADPASQAPPRSSKAKDLIEGTHYYKAAVALYESFPKDDLFGASVEDLRTEVMGLLHLEGAPPGQDVRAPRRRGPLRVDHHRAPPRPLQRRAAATAARAGCSSASAATRRADTCRSARPSWRRASTSRCTSPARRRTCRSPSSSTR